MSRYAPSLNLRVLEAARLILNRMGVRYSLNDLDHIADNMLLLGTSLSEECQQFALYINPNHR